jgi:hypothetical protein
MLQRYVASLALDGTGGTATADTEQIETSVNLTDRIGILVHHVDYYSLYPHDMFVNAADDLRFGLCYAPNLPQDYGYDPDDQGWIDMHILCIDAIGTAASGYIMNGLLGTSDFSREPGEGRLLHPSALYFWAGTNSAGLSAIAQLRACIYFRYTTITDEFYRESLELRLSLTTV